MSINAKDIEEIVRREFDGANVESVRVDFSKDFEGDPIVRVVVVYKNKAEFDPTKARGIARHLWSKVDAFPMVAFRSMSDQKKLEAEAA